MSDASENLVQNVGATYWTVLKSFDVCVANDGECRWTLCETGTKASLAVLATQSIFLSEGSKLVAPHELV